MEQHHERLGFMEEKVRAILALLLTVLSASAQDFDFAQLASPASGTTCNTTCSANVLCEKLENTFGAVWTTNGTYRGAFLAANRNSCSSYALTWGPFNSGDCLKKTEAADYGIAYVDFWWRLNTNFLAAGARSSIASLDTSGGLSIVSVRVTNDASANLSLFALQRDASTDTAGALVPITTNTWYHIGISYKTNTVSGSVFYVSTADALGAAKSTVSTGSRSPGLFSFGNVSSSGSVGNTKYDFDSITVDSTGFKPVEY